MAQIFPKWINHLPIVLMVVIVFLSAGGIGFFWYYGSPQYTDVGYRPNQPIDYSHKVHAGDLGMDCRYC
ncbi:MAG: cytochrome c3 family protein, partial [Calditrichia bacterium]|nr:cytochrome c3 family protein [Calditrichia bacterium]